MSKYFELSLSLNPHFDNFHGSVNESFCFFIFLLAIEIIFTLKVLFFRLVDYNKRKARVLWDY